MTAVYFWWNWIKNNPAVVRNKQVMIIATLKIFVPRLFQKCRDAIYRVSTQQSVGEIRITFIGQTIQQTKCNLFRSAFKIQIENNPAYLSGKVGC